MIIKIKLSFLKTILFLIIGILVMGNITPSHATSEAENVNVLMTLDSEWAMINSEPFKLEQAPLIIGGRTMVPLRFITEALGLDITWEPETRSVLVEKDENLIRLFIDSHKAELNGKTIEVEVPPTILNGRTLVPVRFVSEVLGYAVGWEGLKSEVTITGSKLFTGIEIKQETSIEYDFAYEVLRLVNIERQKAGISSLNMSSRLLEVATVKSQDIVDHDYFSHTSPTFGGLRELLVYHSITYTRAGENLATGQKTPEAVVNAWMNSEGHRANIMNPAFNNIGVGIVAGGKYGGYTWTQLFTN
ncbi:MAG: stalk domain-containing protein [Bacillota bacterium]|nr:stalk domain-containing protein [Bacillota bacterium]